MAKEKQTSKIVTHEFGPFYRSNSKILLLGSIPSVKSREQGFYYMHPQNKFWKVLSCVYEEEYPDTLMKKQDFLVRHQIALWDVLESCEIKGSSDSSIKNPIPNDINSLLLKTDIKFIYTTGKSAHHYYQKYCYPNTKIEATYLPSTSPANVGNYSFEDLKKEYNKIREIERNRK